MAGYKIKITTPSCVLVECTANIVLMPGEEGWFGVMRGHEPLIANLKSGIIEIISQDSKERYFVYGGIAKVNLDTVNVLTRFAVNLDTINKEAILNNISSRKNEVLKETIKYKANILENYILIYNDLLKSYDEYIR